MKHSKLPWKNHVTDVYSGEFGKGKRIALGCEPEDAAFIVTACNEYDTLKAKIYSLELENIALRGAESAAIQEIDFFKAKAELFDEAMTGISDILGVEGHVSHKIITICVDLLSKEKELSK
jgi:hypothetical protein